MTYTRSRFTSTVDRWQTVRPNARQWRTFGAVLTAPASLCVLAKGIPDHKQLIFTAFDPVKGRGSELLRMGTDSGAIYSWGLSPDGTRLAVLNPDEGRIHILHLDGRPKEEIAPKNFTFGDPLDWAADGEGLFVDNPTAKGTALSYLDLHGNTHVVWEETTSVGWRGIETRRGGFRRGMESIWRSTGFMPAAMCGCWRISECHTGRPETMLIFAPDSLHFSNRENT